MTRFNDILNGIKEKLNIKAETNNVYPENEYEEDRLSLISNDDLEEEDELTEYKNDFYEMSVGSIKSIMTHANNILNAVENGDPSVKNNLTESWLQGKIAVTEDYMITIHNFVMFGKSETDTEGSVANKPGLWENIRKKKEREGKNYKPAKRGDKDRPDPESWKKAQK